MAAVVDLVEDDCISAVIDGNPKPLQRNKFKVNWSKRTHWSYNPSKSEIAAFRCQVIAALGNSSIKFGAGEPVSLSIRFYMSRPKHHFVGERRQPGNLRPDCASISCVARGPDVDNMVKFVKDALTGAIYKDDKQVAHLEAWRLFDNVGSCTGRTQIDARKMK